MRLGFFEQVASNGAIVDKLLDAGFVNVLVLGAGRDRWADGEWAGDARDVELPEQITKVTILP